MMPDWPKYARNLGVAPLPWNYDHSVWVPWEDGRATEINPLNPWYEHPRIPRGLWKRKIDETPWELLIWLCDFPRLQMFKVDGVCRYCSGTTAKLKTNSGCMVDWRSFGSPFWDLNQGACVRCYDYINSRNLWGGWYAHEHAERKKPRMRMHHEYSWGEADIEEACEDRAELIRRGLETDDTVKERAIQFKEERRIERLEYIRYRNLHFMENHLWNIEMGLYKTPRPQLAYIYDAWIEATNQMMIKHNIVMNGERKKQRANEQFKRLIVERKIPRSLICPGPGVGTFVCGKRLTERSLWVKAVNERNTEKYYCRSCAGKVRNRATKRKARRKK